MKTELAQLWHDRPRRFALIAFVVLMFTAPVAVDAMWLVVPPGILAPIPVPVWVPQWLIQ